MKKKQLIEWFLYAAIVILALIAIGLVLISPPEFVKNKVIYGGF
jgi:hypothetical protein